MTITLPLEHLRQMWTIRAFEEKVRDLRLADEIAGSVHLCIGQESTAVGGCEGLRPHDALFATYRGHGWAIARGVPLEPLFAELLGRVHGVNGGRGGSAYFSAGSYGFYGENSIVGGGVPIAVGAALASRHDGSGRVAVVVFGDGAMNQGSVTEAMNFAAAFDLPVIFICENNTYSELTPIADMVRDPDLSKRPAALGIESTRLDGNDVLLLAEQIGAAVGAAASGSGPFFFELSTQRMCGHYIGDAEQYRPAGELDSYLDIEPIARLSGELAAKGVDADDISQVETEARAEVNSAAESALRQPLSDSANARSHVYA